jgi:hypothetical protein
MEGKCFNRDSAPLAATCSSRSHDGTDFHAKFRNILDSSTKSHDLPLQRRLMRMHVDVSSLLLESRVRPMPNSLGPDTTLGELVVAEGASVRLTNCVQRSDLAALTISQAFEMGPSLDVVCLRVPAMGRKSVRELHELLDRVAARSQISLVIKTEEQQTSLPPLADDKATPADLLNHVAALYSAVTLAETVQAIGASVRLT